MKTFPCRCGNRLYFANTACTACGSEVGWCDSCHRVTALEPIDGAYRCAGVECGQTVLKCDNYVTHQACNWTFLAAEASDSGLCRSCQTTAIIPDLNVDNNLSSWRALEAAKRRLLFELDSLNLQYDAAEDRAPLTFRFEADLPNAPKHTGHQDGVVTINIREADPVAREELKQQFDEPQRTLIGHFRHEVGHYFWMTLVEGKETKKDAIKLFGDPEDPPYADALKKHYSEGPAADWEGKYVSAYATSHAWEDFAETFAFYLDLRSVLATLQHHAPDLVGDAPSNAQELIDAYCRVGIALNEVNRTMGLIDLVPEVIGPKVREKLGFIHHLLSPVHSPARRRVTAARASV